MAGGRPTKYHPDMCGQIVALMGEGLSKEAAAHEMGLAKQRLYDYEERHEEFRDAIKDGELASLNFYERAGAQGMVGEIEGFNATVWVFQMKNRAGWRDRIEQKTEVSLADELRSKIKAVIDASE